jgi:hypothetical protein
MDLNPVESFPKTRLIVLVPTGLAGSPDLAKKIYWLALRYQCDVLYLASVDDEDEKLSVSRSMATMKALTSNELVAVRTKLTYEKDWLKILKEVCLPGDRIICHEEQFVRTGFLKAVPIRDSLSEVFNGPIVTISGLYHPWRVISRKWLYRLLFWLASPLILALFTLLEIQIDQTIQGLTRTILLLAVLVVEVWTFWAWNHLPKY